MKDYKPTGTNVTLTGNDVIKVCDNSPVYVVVDGKVRILECVAFNNHRTYLIAGKEVEE